jgi:hypothetical protein
MWICYIDEAGCTGILPGYVSDIQPIFVLAGVIVDQTRLYDLTSDFLDFKRKFFPNATLPSGSPPQRPLDWALFEIKGADVRRFLAASSSTQRHFAVGLLTEFVALLQKHQIRITGRLIAKGVNEPMKGVAIYTAAMQDICRTFHHFLGTTHSDGIIIADSRNKEQNARVSHSIFTQKFKFDGDEHSRILEMPTFGNSENHVGIQLADLLCSALLFPMAIDAFCSGILTSCHVRDPFYRVLRERFGAALRHLQHRFEPEPGRWRGGIRIENRLTTTIPDAYLFRVPPQ